MDIRIGISGWVYPPWRQIFYPANLPQKNELYFASRQLNSIEINASFYSYQKPDTYRKWYGETPDHFIFSVKGPQYITHVLRLKDVKQPLANFFASGVLYLGRKLGPFLWQLPPNFVCDLDRLESFFKLLPKNYAEAVRLANTSNRFEEKYPDEWSRLKTPLHHALEVRHHSFENPDFIELLRKYKITLVFADTAGKWPYLEDVTGDFLYMRLHGDEILYESGYDDATLRWWADRIKLWTQGKQPQDALTVSELKPQIKSRNAYIYFDNDLKVRAPQDAKTLMKFLDVSATETNQWATGAKL